MKGLRASKARGGLEGLHGAGASWVVCSRFTDSLLEYTGGQCQTKPRV